MFTELINPISDSLVQFLYQQCCFSLVLFVMIFFLARVLKKTSRFMLFGLWGLLFLRLLLPTDFAVAFSGRMLVDRFVQWLHSLFMPEFDSTIVNNTTVTVNEQIVSQVHSGQSLFSLGNFIIALWFLGFMGLTLIYFRQLHRYHKLIKCAGPCTDNHINQLLTQWQREFRVGRKVRIVVGDTMVPPFTVGLIKPVIYLSDYLCNDKVAVESIIAHEMVHIKHLDDIWIKLQNMIQFFYFFNPIVWLAGANLTQLREQLCDTCVLARGRISQQAYGNGLLNIVNLNMNSRTPMWSMASFGNRKERLYDRIVNIKRSVALSRRQNLLSFLVLAALGLMVLPMAKSSAKLGQDAMLISPLGNGHIGLEYGLDWDPGLKSTYMHKGVDIADYSKPSNIIAVADGNVISTGQDEIFKEFREITIQHANGLRTRYLHLDKVNVQSGCVVKQGQVIGHVPHCVHFEVYKDNVIQDPEDYISVRKEITRHVIKPENR